METILVFKVSALYLHQNSATNIVFYLKTRPTMITKWNINEDQSDVLIRMKDSTLTYLGGQTNHFSGFVAIDEDGIEDASVEFSLDNTTLPSRKRNGIKTEEELILNKRPLIRFKSTSFQKIKNNINFLKGHLTIKDITRIVELDAEFIGINNYNGAQKAAFEIKGNINRRDFGLEENFYYPKGKLHFGKDLKLIANLEFSI